MALLLAGGVMASSLTGEAATEPVKEPIFAPGSVPFAASHASTVVELKNGDLMSAWFGGTAEGKPDVAIWGATRTRAQWSAPVELAREPDVPCWNPVLFHTRDGKLWLYYKFGPSPQTWVGARKWSTDKARPGAQLSIYLPACWGLFGRSHWCCRMARLSVGRRSKHTAPGQRGLSAVRMTARPGRRLGRSTSH